MADGARKRTFLLKRFLHDRLHPGSIVGNSHYDWSYKDEEGVADPHDFLCYGCDEGRNGYVINIRRKLGEIELDEQACRGCMRFLDSIRLFSIPFVQLGSHKGCTRWAISLSDFAEHKTLFTFDPTDIDTYRRDGYIEFQFSDGGYDDVVLVRALLRAGLLEADYYETKNRVKNPTLEL
jgi:hypothetical protein